MNFELNSQQLAFTRKSITASDWELFQQRAFLEIARLTSVNPGVPSFANLFHWELPFGVRVPAKGNTPADVNTAFREALGTLKLGEGDVFLLSHTRSLFEYYFLRREPAHPDRFHCTHDHIKNAWIWLVQWADGVDLSKGMQVTYEWLESHPEVTYRKPWETQCGGIFVRCYQNGRIDMRLNPTQQRRIDAVFKLYERQRQLEAAADKRLREEHHRRQDVQRNQLAKYSTRRAKA